MVRWIERKETAPFDRAFYRIGPDEPSHGRAAPAVAGAPAGLRFIPGTPLPILLSMGTEETWT